ncbi:MAG: rod shape-determining protein [Veillonella sp.]|uniref:rod shape-determining protein n=1 Tax=Veillonella sp. TaxID=1926307 RepID=UPI0025CFB356|nr:rod shape-determining protein [Veillonella sp.]MBS4913566.1 rod shape-determining protein [Veillonella sp.]
MNKKTVNRAEVRKKREERRKKSTQPIATTTPTKAQKRSSAGISLFERLALWWAYDIGIDLGTANVLIYVKGKGVVLDEPGYVAWNSRTHEVVAVGDDARIMLGRTPEEIEVIRPLQDGVITNYDMTEFMLRYYIRSVIPSSSLFKPRIVVCVPSGITPVEKRAVIEAVLQTGARKTVLIEEPLAAALGTGLDKAKSAGAIVVDIGGGTTDIAVLSNTGIVVSKSLRMGGDKFDEAIINYIKRRRKMLIGHRTAEEIKIAVGTVDRKAAVEEIKVRGRDMVSGLPQTITVTSKEVQLALEKPINSILEGIKDILEKTPPELVAEIADHGILLTGGGALISGLERLVTRSIGVAAYLVDNPRYSVILGTGRALQEMDKLQDSLEELQ